MLAKFNTPSTGLDGVKPLEYHVGVHPWVAANLNILGGQAPLLLAICQQIAFFACIIFYRSISPQLLSIYSSLNIGSLWVYFFSFVVVRNSYLGFLFSR